MRALLGLDAVVTIGTAQNKGDAMSLWIPAGAKTLPRVELPAGEIRLRDGRVLRQLADDRSWLAFMKDQGSVEARAWRGPQGLSVIGSMDETLHGLLLHVSLAYPKRDPSWADIRLVRDAFYPNDVDVMMVLPAERDYVNLHEHAFHLWQTPTGWGLR